MFLLDMDGVIANFDKRVCDLYEKPAPGPDVSAKDLCEYLGVTDDEMWKKVMSDEDFWPSLAVLPGAKRLWSGMKRLAETRICTSCGRDYRAASAKLFWLESHGFDANGAVVTKWKEGLGKPGQVLVDDREEKTAPFESAGGKVILFPSLWNRERFQGSHDEAVDLVLSKARQMVAGA